MQLTDVNGNIYGVLGLEITGIDGKPKVPVIPATLIVNSTPITGGTAGRILFEGTGNVLQESSNLFWDQVNNRLGVGTNAPSAIIHSVGSVTASGAIARGNYLQPTLVATANNDVLVGLDIAPTFTNGAFTGVTNYAARFQGYGINIANDGGTIDFINSGTNGRIRSNGGTFSLTVGSGGDGSFPLQIGHTNATGTKGLALAANVIRFQTGNFGTVVGQIFSTTGNWLLQNGGTFTDAGYRLDVKGTARITGSVVFNSAMTIGGASAFGGSMVIGNNSVTEASAKLEVRATTQGFLPPRMTTTQRDAITSPAVGLQIFNTTTSCVEYFDTFWGWIPVNANSQWYASYGIDYFSDGIGSDDIIFAATNSGVGTGLNTGANILGRGQGNTTFILGTTTNGAAGIFTRTPFILGNGRIVNEYGFQRNAASTAAERYYAIFGFFDVFGAPNQIDGAYFLYDEGGVSSGSTASPNWQCVTSSNNVRTFTTTSVVVVGSYTKLRIEINDAATQVLFYINGTLVATHTTNIPTGTARSVNWGASVQKQVGTTSLQTFVVDYYLFKQKFTTPR